MSGAGEGRPVPVVSHGVKRGGEVCAGIHLRLPLGEEVGELCDFGGAGDRVSLGVGSGLAATAQRSETLPPAESPVTKGQQTQDT